MSFLKITLIAAALSIVALGAQAQSSNSEASMLGLYVGGSLNNTKITGIGTKNGFDAFGGYLGYKINSTFAVEGAVHGLGKININGGSMSAYNASVVASMPLHTDVSVFARVGFGSIKGSTSGAIIDAKATGAKLSATGSSALFGLGARYNINQNLAVRAEYTRLASDTGTFGVGLQYGF
jgi:opacity protein-like surface antigen